MTLLQQETVALYEARNRLFEQVGPGQAQALTDVINLGIEYALNFVRAAHAMLDSIINKLHLFQH